MRAPLAAACVLLVALVPGSPARAGGALTALLPDEAAYRAADAARGREIFAPCAACHGADAAGNAALEAPGLAGQNAQYLRRQLQHFRAGIRGGEGEPAARMRAAAALLPDDRAVVDVAVYLAGLPAARPPATLGGDARQGAGLYPGCLLCHGPDGRGLPAIGFPSLRVQGDWYLVRQLALFRQGVRGAHPDDGPGQLMRSAAGSVWTDADARNLAAYVRSGP
jgi:cytochrome c oxidase subunit 2